VAKELSLQEFKVMMGVYGDAIAVVDIQSRRIDGVLGELRGAFLEAEQHWSSPGGATFGDVVREYDTDAVNLSDLLAEILHRMRQTFKNYHEVEVRAVQNLKNQAPGPPQGHDRHTTGANNQTQPPATATSGAVAVQPEQADLRRAYSEVADVPGVPAR
jgi:uncharacterized protein YukE